MEIPSHAYIDILRNRLQALESDVAATETLRARIDKCEVDRESLAATALARVYCKPKLQAESMDLYCVQVARSMLCFTSYMPGQQPHAHPCSSLLMLQVASHANTEPNLYALQSCKYSLHIICSRL